MAAPEDLADDLAGYWSSPWPAEDGGPSRHQRAVGVSGDCSGARVGASREAVAATMVVLREPGEVFALRHTLGPRSSSWVERIDPLTLETVARSADLDGGPTWPGGIAAHANGSLYVVFGRHVHRLSSGLDVLATRELPRDRPYNSFVVLPDGTLITKDFGGVLPGGDSQAHVYEPCEVIAVDPDSLEIRSRCVLPEASIARVSADGSTVYVVGLTALHRVVWDGSSLRRDHAFVAPYVTVAGQTYGWDPVIALGAAWFLDNGFGSERYAGTFRGQGVNTAPLHLVRVDLATGAVSLTEICGRANGVVANPPVVDTDRRIVVGFDSGNGVMAAFDIDAGGALSPRWTCDQNHGSHMLSFPAPGVLMTGHHDADRMAETVRFLDVETGVVLAEVESGSPVQSVVFPAPGWNNDVYYCSFATITRIAF